MIRPDTRLRVYLCREPVDMRKQIDGLAGLVEHALKHDPFSGHLFVFRGRQGDLVKVIWWDGQVAPCDVDYLTTLIKETLNSSSISEIWNGDIYQQLRQKHVSGERQNIEPCSRCVVV